MTDLPYTEETLRLVTEALGTTVFAQTLEDDAHAVLTALATANLLVTPRLQLRRGGMSGSAPREEGFTATADRDGGMSIQCYLYAKGCWWDEPFGTLTPTGDDLGSLLAAAREHLRTAHPEGTPDL